MGGEQGVNKWEGHKGLTSGRYTSGRSTGVDKWEEHKGLTSGRSTRG